MFVFFNLMTPNTNCVFVVVSVVFCCYESRKNLTLAVGLTTFTV